MIFASLNAFSQVSEDNICGYWYTENNEAIIEIIKTGSNNFNGRFCWLMEPDEPDSTNDNYGKPKIDHHTGLPYLRTMILQDAFYIGSGKWKGKIYDPRHGRSYSCNISISEDSDIMIIKGYIGVSLIGKRVIWTRTSSCK